MLAVLCAMNLLDSVDRRLLAAVLPVVRSELDLSEDQAGWLATLMLLSFAITSLLFGYLIDRFNRPRLLALGFALWSLATVSTGRARSNDQMQLARGLVGCGGAISTVIALSLIMDVFPRRSGRACWRPTSFRCRWERPSPRALGWRWRR